MQFTQVIARKILHTPGAQANWIFLARAATGDKGAHDQLTQETQDQSLSADTVTFIGAGMLMRESLPPVVHARMHPTPRWPGGHQVPLRDAQDLTNASTQVHIVRSRLHIRFP